MAQFKMIPPEQARKGNHALWDIYDLLKNLAERFDIVFTSIGVLCCLSNLKTWPRIITGFMKPGGMFYLWDAHPLLSTVDEDGRWIFDFNYGRNLDPYFWGVDGRYGYPGMPVRLPVVFSLKAFNPKEGI
jgi:hypothetical protein